jgi:hypothetical protein
MLPVFYAVRLKSFLKGWTHDFFVLNRKRHGMVDTKRSKQYFDRFKINRGGSRFMIKISENGFRVSRKRYGTIG